jgi:hypothetical protein
VTGSELSDNTMEDGSSIPPATDKPMLTCRVCGTTIERDSMAACAWGPRGCKTRPGDPPLDTCWTDLAPDDRVELVELGCRTAASRLRDERAEVTEAVNALLRERLGDNAVEPTGNSSADADRSLPAVNVTVPHPARLYDYLLGGKDNFAVDRALGRKMVVEFPMLRATVRANRACMRRIVEYLAAVCGVDQFLDIGCGLPASNNVHEVAQQFRPEARVVFVDDDSLVAAHARALLTSTTGTGRTAFMLADARRPHRILAEVAQEGILDLNRPVAVLLISVLMYFDTDTTHQIVRTLIDGLPSGSYLAITHPTGDFDDDGSATRAVAVAAKGGLTYNLRGRDEIAKLVADLDLVDPGLVPMAAWRPEPQLRPVDPHSVFYYTVLARKP